jgi:hypothetical protein
MAMAITSGFKLPRAKVTSTPIRHRERSMEPFYKKPFVYGSNSTSTPEIRIDGPEI